MSPKAFEACVDVRKINVCAEGSGGQMNSEKEPSMIEARSPNKRATFGWEAELKMQIVLQSPPRSKEDLLVTPVETGKGLWAECEM